MTGWQMELLATWCMVGGGVLAMMAAGLRGWGIIPWGIAAGLCLQVGTVFLQVLTPLPGHPALTLAVVGGGPLAWYLVRRRTRPLAAVRPWVAVGTAAGLAALVAFNRAFDTFAYHVDSLEYLGAGALVADDRYADYASVDTLDKRLLGVTALHLPARLAGEFALESVTPLVALAIIGLVGWALYTRASRDLGAKTGWFFAGLSAIALVTMNRFLFNAVYLNGHLLTALALLMVAVAGWLALNRDPESRPALVAAAFALVAIVVTRPEGALLGALALVPVIASPIVEASIRRALLRTLGASVIAWYGFVTIDKASRDIPLGTSGLMALTGVAALTASFVVGWRWLDARSRAIPYVAELGIWLVLLVFTLRAPSILRESVRALWFNVMGPVGSWGVSFGIVVLLVVVAAASRPGESFGPLRLAVTTFLPVMFVLAFARGSAYRVGMADSLNRMIIEVVPLAVLFGLAVAARARAERGPTREFVKVSVSRRVPGRLS